MGNSFKKDSCHGDYFYDRIDEMTEEEKEKFYANLTLTYTKVIFTMEMIRSDFYREFIG